jgi:hypothetical protein
MRKKLRVGAGVAVAGGCVLWAAGCGGPPTAFERHFFNVTMNFPPGWRGSGGGAAEPGGCGVAAG